MDPHSHYPGLFRTVSQATTSTTKTTSSTSSSRTIRASASTSVIHDPSGLNYQLGPGAGPSGHYGYLAPNHPYHPHAQGGMGFAPIPPARSSSLNLSSTRFMPYQAQQQQGLQVQHGSAESSAMGAMAHSQAGMMGPPQFPHHAQQQLHQQHQHLPQQQQQNIWNQPIGVNPYITQGVYQMSAPEQGIASSSSISLLPQEHSGDGEDDEEEEENMDNASKPKRRTRRHTEGDVAGGGDAVLAEAKKMRTREKGRERQRRKRERDRQAREVSLHAPPSWIAVLMNQISRSSANRSSSTSNDPTQSSAAQAQSFDSAQYDFSASEPSSVSSSSSALPTVSNHDFPSYSPSLSYTSASASEQSSPGVSLSRSLPLDGGMMNNGMALDLGDSAATAQRWNFMSSLSQPDFQLQPPPLPMGSQPLSAGSSADRGVKRTKRRQSEPQPADPRPVPAHALPRPTTSTANTSARPPGRRISSDGSSFHIPPSPATANAMNPQQSVSATHSQASSFFASTLIFGITNSNLLKSLQQNVGIGRNELEEMRGALASVFEQYQVQRGMRNVSIQEESSSQGSQSGATVEDRVEMSTPLSSSTSEFSTPASEQRMGLPSLVLNGSGMGYIDPSQPLSASSSTSSVGQPFSVDMNLVNPPIASPTRLASSATQSPWDAFGPNVAAQPMSQPISQHASPIRPVRAPGRQMTSPTFPTSAQNTQNQMASSMAFPNAETMQLGNISQSWSTNQTGQGTFDMVMNLGSGIGDADRAGEGTLHGHARAQSAEGRGRVLQQQGGSTQQGHSHLYTSGQ